MTGQLDVDGRGPRRATGAERFGTVVIGGGQVGLSVGTTWPDGTGRS